MRLMERYVDWHVLHLRAESTSHFVHLHHVAFAKSTHASIDRTKLFSLNQGAMYSAMSSVRTPHSWTGVLKVWTPKMKANEVIYETNRPKPSRSK